MTDADALLCRLAADLDRLMTANSLTQAELAERSGVHRVTINQVLQAGRRVRMGTLHQLAHALGCRVEIRFIEHKL